MSTTSESSENSVTKKYDTDEMLEYIRSNGGVISDPNIMIKFIEGTKNGMYLQYGSLKVKNNERVVRFALNYQGAAIMKASSRLQNELESVARASPDPPDPAPYWVPR